MLSLVEIIVRWCNRLCNFNRAFYWKALATFNFIKPINTNLPSLILKLMLQRKNAYLAKEIKMGLPCRNMQNTVFNKFKFLYFTLSISIPST